MIPFIIIEICAMARGHPRVVAGIGIFVAVLLSLLW